MARLLLDAGSCSDSVHRSRPIRRSSDLKPQFLAVAAHYSREMLAARRLGMQWFILLLLSLHVKDRIQVRDGIDGIHAISGTHASRVEEGCWFRLRLTSISGFPRLWRNIRLPCQHLLLPRQTGLADFPHPAFPNLSAASMHQGSARFVHSGWKPSSSSST